MVIIIEYLENGVNAMRVWFLEHLLNHCHWIYIRLQEDAPQDAFHKRLAWITDVGVRDCINCLLEVSWEVDFSACPSPDE